MRIPWRGPTQFRAVVRFSVFDPDWGGWRATNSGAFSSAEDYRDYLWSPERMEPRMRMFGKVSLPIHQALAERHDYRILVQYSPGLPAEWTEQLHEFARAYPVLDLVPVDGWVEARDTVAQRLDGGTGRGQVVMLRVDDDDILSADFLDQLEPYVVPEHHGWCVSLGRGLVARMRDGELVEFRGLDFPFNSVGQAYLGRRTRSGLDMPALVSHRHVHKTFPTVVDSRSVAFIQVRHPSQDSHVGEDPEATRREMLRKLRSLPKIEDFTELGAKFPTLVDAFEQYRQRQPAARGQSTR